MSVALIALTGPRAWTNIPLLEDTLLGVWHDALEIGYDGIELMQGCAEGADTIGDRWARRNGILVRERPADWDGPCGPACQPGHRRRNRRGTEFCPQAGHRRNQQMVDEQPLLFVAGVMRCTAPKCAGKAPHNTHGAADCIRRAEAAGIPVLRCLA
ncbi:SLOG family protein [Streptomyces pseudovenezuelae]|uniref:SLOG family protein n=1 Tax=Streptomyces pseudovenezuelae TaxID=67350 RepID=UPI0036E47A03